MGTWGQEHLLRRVGENVADVLAQESVNLGLWLTPTSLIFFSGPRANDYILNGYILSTYIIYLTLPLGLQSLQFYCMGLCKDRLLISD